MFGRYDSIDFRTDCALIRAGEEVKNKRLFLKTAEKILKFQRDIYDEEDFYRDCTRLSQGKRIVNKTAFLEWLKAALYNNQE